MGKQRQPKDKFVEANGLNLHYVEWEGNNAHTVVCLHGGTGNARDWDTVARDLSPEYRVICFDQRGHGKSDWSIDGYWPWQLAEDLHQAIQQLDVSSVHLLGQSMGVWTAIAYAGNHWQDLAHLVLTDFGPEVGVDVARSINSNIAYRPRAFRNSEEAYLWLQQAYPTRPDPLLRRRVEHGMRENWVGRMIWLHDPEFTYITGSAGKQAHSYLWTQLAKIECPTLIVRGENSTHLTPELLDRMVALVPSAEGAIVKDSEHFLFDENPDEYIQTVRAFLEE